MVIQYYEVESSPDDLYTLPEKELSFNFKANYASDDVKNAALCDLAEDCIKHHYNCHDGWEWGGEAPTIVVVVDGKEVGTFESSIDYDPVFMSSLLD